MEELKKKIQEWTKEWDLIRLSNKCNVNVFNYNLEISYIDKIGLTINNSDTLISINFLNELTLFID